MTMILGINLSDKVYLAGDTRVTYKPSMDTDDNILKIIPIIDTAIYGSGYSICMAVAGDLKFAQYLHKEIYDGLNIKKELSPDIRIFYSQIDNYIKKLIISWVNTKGSYPSAAIIFSGVCKDRLKQIDFEKLEALVDKYNYSYENNKIFHENQLPELIKVDSLWSSLNKAIMRDNNGKGLLDKLNESRKIIYPQHIQQALTNKNPKLDGVYDSFVFGAQVLSRTCSVNLEVANWGEFLTYGDSVKKDSIPPDTMSILELHHGRTVNSPHLLESSVMTRSILDFALENHINSIGGTVVVLSSSNDSNSIIGKDLILNNGPVKVLLGNNLIPLIPFVNFNLEASACLDADL